MPRRVAGGRSTLSHVLYHSGLTLWTFIVRCKRGKKLLPDVDVSKFNAQYSNSLMVKESDLFHDRFIVIDRKTLIHIGASLNYLGKKCFVVSTFDPLGIPELLAKLPR